MPAKKEISAILLDRPGVLAAPERSDERRRFFEVVISKVRRLADRIEVLTSDPDCHASVDLPRISPTTAAAFFDHVAKAHAGRVVLVLNAYAALFDLESAKGMLAEHLRFSFDYTYPENLPKGLLPEILSSDAAALIRQTLPENFPLFRENVRECFEKDVSSYDSNIFVTDSRIARYRVDFTPGSDQDALVMRDILAAEGPDRTIGGIEEAIRRDPGLIRRAPAFYEIELTGIRESGVDFIGNRMQDRGAMPLSTFALALASAERLSGNPVVSLGLYGEPLLHPDFDGILDEMRKYPRFRFLVESRGLSGPSKNAQKALELPNVEFLVDLSAAESPTFEVFKRPLDPAVPFEALSAVEERVKALEPKDRVYIQFTRTPRNEQDLMRFYDKWRDYGDRIVIRKPDTFGGLLDGSRVVDLSPVERQYCYHLQRDIVIRADGTVPLCRQDFNCENPAGNLLKDSLEACWKNMQTAYNAHWNGDFSHPAICAKCDEWWIFNF
jgi:spiro-SPASM protein